MKLEDFPKCISKYNVYITTSKIQVYRKKEKVLSLDSTSHFFEGFKHGYDELTEIGGDRVAFIEIYINLQEMFK